MSALKKGLQQLAILLQLLWAFLPAILFILFAYVFFSGFVQGKDIILTGLKSRQTGLFFIIGLLFWVLITWYTSRLIAYNHDRLFQVAQKGLYHAPRILGYACFTVTIIALAVLNPAESNNWIELMILSISAIGYAVLHPLFEKIKNKSNRKALILYRNGLWLLFIIIIGTMVLLNTILSYICMLPVLQAGYLFLVITRKKISENNQKHHPDPAHKNLINIQLAYHHLVVWIFTDKEGKRESLKKELMIQTEKNIFLWFNIFSFAAMLVYFAAVFSISFSRYITSLPIILLSFGILLGAGNIITLFSLKQKINFHFLVLVAIVIAGLFNEPHFVNLMPLKENNQYHARPSLRAHFNGWIQERKNQLEDSSLNNFPVYFVVADGGASRSAYWTASVLGKIQEESSGHFSKQVFCLSGASGGSLGNISFYATLINKSGHHTTKTVQDYLSNDFLSFPLVRLLGPDIILPLVPFHLLHDRAAALEKSFQSTKKENEITQVMNLPFSALQLRHDSSYALPLIFINCTRMQDGTPAVVSNLNIEKNVFGKRIDVLKSLDSTKDLSVATAVALGARFPYFSPAGRIGNQYFVDGGYFDNSGAGVVHEMLLDLQSMIMDSIKNNPQHPYKKIRFNVLHITNEPETEKKIEKTHPLVNDLAAPVKTILGSYARQTDINNLRLYKYLLEIYKEDTTYRSINLYKKGEEEDYPMNWSISDQSLGRMNRRLATHEGVANILQSIKQ
jgi:hypothetical protein